MAENKTQRTTASVAAFLSSIPDADRKRDAKALADLIQSSTGERPAMWGTAIVGYGDMTYEGSGGRMVDWFPVGFSPRKGALVLYLMGGLRTHAGLLADLGPHKIGGGCLYLTRYDAVDTNVLARIIKACHASNRQVTKRVAAKPKAKKRKG